MSEDLEARVAALEDLVAGALDVKAELAHWIGEAKRFERWWRTAQESAARYLSQRDEARHAIALAQEETERP